MLTSARFIRSGQVCILVAAICFIVLERLLGRHYVPREFHPAATTAMVTALLFWLVFWVMILWEIISGNESRMIPATAGIATGSFFIAIAGLLLGIGESGCSAWMFTAAMITGLLGILWWNETGWPGLVAVDSDVVRQTLAKTGLVLFFVLAPLAHFLNW